MATWEDYIDPAAAFDEQNPVVYDQVVRWARELRDRGVQRFGIPLLWERVRYELSLESGGEYKLNNNFRAVYARVIIANVPDLADHLVIRDSTAEE